MDGIRQSLDEDGGDTGRGIVVLLDGVSSSGKSVAREFVKLLSGGQLGGPME